jgi:hypothetical protein
LHTAFPLTAVVQVAIKSTLEEHRGVEPLSRG